MSRFSGTSPYPIWPLSSLNRISLSNDIFNGWFDAQGLVKLIYLVTECTDRVHLAL